MSETDRGPVIHNAVVRTAASLSAAVAHHVRCSARLILYTIFAVI